MFTKTSILLCSLMSLDVFGLLNCESDTSEIVSQGRVQYRLLRERGNLPKYGQCWKAALDNVEEGCRELSEEIQSDIALSLTNCFLEMSGLEIHHCETDKKQNVRRICISSLSDRAFNVYTEFYTHTLNMCWFLRGQIWQEQMSENTLKVGKQLEFTAEKQEKLLEIQKESLEVQDKMLRHSKTIEGVLSQLSKSAEINMEMLTALGQTVVNMQSWLIGEVSWVNTLIFNVSAGIFIIIFTSTPRTIISRLPLLCLLSMNFILERMLCNYILSGLDVNVSGIAIHRNLKTCVRILRIVFSTVSLGILCYKAYFYEDALTKNKTILENIYKQNERIMDKLDSSKNGKRLPDRTYLVYKANVIDSAAGSPKKIEDERSDNDSLSFSNNGVDNRNNGSVIGCISGMTMSMVNTRSYNLRSRQNSPNLK